ncbi:hypothetical protein [Borreliella lusitaniae]|uniref:hypothetical protein n=1 Tax=Borreliella lusitaniae TaxID=100177 RepID=UPI00292EDB2C|nr:hypothetical protein [Borreliella lusitaniae]WNY67322.1 hypothetical protein QIA40_04895 [Borreliella lusitaniae]
MYEENSSENKFQVTLEGVLDRNATKSNLKKELLNLRLENFLSEINFFPKSSKDFLSSSLERLKSFKSLKNYNIHQKSASFNPLNTLSKSSPSPKEHFCQDFKKNSLESVLKDLDSSKDKMSQAFKTSDLKSYLKKELESLDLSSSNKYSYFKTENIQNTFKKNFINKSFKDQTGRLKDFRLNSNFEKTRLKLAQEEGLREPFLKIENSKPLFQNLKSFKNLLKDLSFDDFLDVKNSFNDFKSLKEFKNLKDKKNPELSLENFVCKQSQKEIANKMLKDQRSFKTEFERNDFLRKLYVFQGLQNSNSNDFSFMVELAQKLKNEGHAKNDSKAISLIGDFLKAENNNLEEFLSFNKQSVFLKSRAKAEPEVLNSSKIVNSVFEPKLDPILEKTLELLEWAKDYDFTSSVLDPLRNTFSSLGNLFAQAFESLPLVEYMTNVLRDGGGEFNFRGMSDDDDSRMP